MAYVSVKNNLTGSHNLFLTGVPFYEVISVAP